MGIDDPPRPWGRREPTMDREDWDYAVWRTIDVYYGTEAVFAVEDNLNEPVWDEAYAKGDTPEEFAKLIAGRLGLRRTRWH